MQKEQSCGDLLRSSVLFGLFIMGLANAAYAVEPTYQFDIPAESLGQALTDFSQVSAQQIIFSEDIVKGRNSSGLHGRYTSSQALDALLAGTDLTIETNPNGVLMLRSKNANTSQAPIALETVLVTAQKRLESDQTVPITTTAFSSKALDAYRIQNLSDVSRLVPGLLVSTFSENSPTIAIRGATNTFSQIGVSKPVAVVVDDVFIPRTSAAVFELFDLESISVLEGPQGTLFGRNVTGGAIVIETRKPTFDHFGLEAEATAGNLGDYQFNGLVNIPLNDRAAFNFSVSAQHRDGWGFDRLTGRQEDDINSQNYRANLRVAATEELEVLVRADYSNDWNGGRTLSSTQVGNDGNPRTSELGVPQDFTRGIGGGSTRIVWQAPVGEVTSITAYRHSHSGEDYSGVGANYVFLTSGSQSIVGDDDQVGTFSQEIRYASPKWTYGDFLTGLYYLNEDANRELATHGLKAVTGTLTSSTLADEFVRTISYAGFADGVFHLFPKVDFTAGARYTYDKKTATLFYSDFVRPANTFSAQDHNADWNQLTPRGVLSWRPADDALVYASVTRGFTAGGFNTDASSAKAFAQTFNPEIVTNYELGLKTQWLDDSLRVNASAFEMKYRDKQELVFNSTNFILDIVNASAATAKGFEIETAYKPIRWFELTANYAKLHTVYDQFVLGKVNNTGHMLSSSPPNKYSFAADLNYPVGDAGFAIGSASYSWIDSYNTGAAADPNLQIPSYGLVNLTCGYETADHRYRLTAWTKNLGNVDYILTRSTQVVRAEYLGEPRTFGVTFRVSF